MDEAAVAAAGAQISFLYNEGSCLHPSPCSQLHSFHVIYITHAEEHLLSLVSTTNGHDLYPACLSNAEEQAPHFLVRWVIVNGGKTTFLIFRWDLSPFAEQRATALVWAASDVVLPRHIFFCCSIWNRKTSSEELEPRVHWKIIIMERENEKKKNAGHLNEELGFHLGRSFLHSWKTSPAIIFSVCEVFTWSSLPAAQVDESPKLICRYKAKCSLLLSTS